MRTTSFVPAAPTTPPLAASAPSSGPWWIRADGVPPEMTYDDKGQVARHAVRADVDALDAAAVVGVGQDHHRGLVFDIRPRAARAAVRHGVLVFPADTQTTTVQDASRRGEIRLWRAGAAAAGTQA